jgi:hypothetical protein
MPLNGIGFFYLCIVIKDMSSMKWKKKGVDSVDYINGYQISEVWGTYHYIAREIAPRLKAFKALDKHGWPEDFENQEDWNKAIQKMIDAFELLDHITTYTDEEKQAIEEGLDLFCKHFRNLWD